jgi:tyrosyl-tRNA synthetase
MYGDDNQACGLTISLLVKADGTKFGKSDSGAIYLDKKYTSPFAMYQFLYNQSDSDVEKLLKFLTMLTKEEINEIMKEHKDSSFLRKAQSKLAQAIVIDIHGQTEYERCVKISQALFKGQLESLTNEELYDALTSLPSFKTTNDSYNVIDLLVACKVCSSKSEGRKLIESKAIFINNKIINSFDATITKTDGIENKFSYIKKGKKSYYLVKW